jgi:hypothetical protein
MIQFGSDLVEVNLMALCKNPVASLPEKITKQLRAFHILKERFGENAEWAKEFLKDPQLSGDGSELLAEYGLTRENMMGADLQEDLESRLYDPDLTATSPLTVGLTNEIVSSLYTAMADYNNEAKDDKTAEEKVKERKKDYTSAVHEWLKVLAEKNVLEPLA